jgi:triacylglycerol lipase
MGQLTSRGRTRWITLFGLLQFLLPGPVHSAALPSDPLLGGRRVLLVHGINDSAKSMARMKRFLEARGWHVYSISLRPNDGSVPFDVMARQLDAFVAAAIPSREKFDLVAFSMGGLVARYYIQKMGGYGRVRRFVSISTPNHGTLWAWLSGRAGVKQMRPNSEMLRDLNADVSKLVALDYTSIYTPLDLTIVPAASSSMPVARNVISWVPLHPLMVMMPGPMHAVERALE